MQEETNKAIQGLSEAVFGVSSVAKRLAEGTAINFEPFKKMAEIHAKNISALTNTFSGININLEKQASAFKRLGELMNTPRARIEYFIYKKAHKRTHFDLMIQESAKKLIRLIQDALNRLGYLFRIQIPSQNLSHSNSNSRIMALRGLALTCAPNSHPKSGNLITSRLVSGIA